MEYSLRGKIGWFFICISDRARSNVTCTVDAISGESCDALTFERANFISAGS